MKGKDDIFKSLENADNDLLEILDREYLPLSGEEKIRILKKSEKKLAQRKTSVHDLSEDDGCVTITEIENTAKWYRHLGKIAACFVGLIAVSAAVMFAVNNGWKNVPVSEGVGSSSCATPDEARFVSSSCAVSETGKNEAVSDTGEIQNASDRFDTNTDTEQGTDEMSSDNESAITETEQEVLQDDTEYNMGFTGKNRLLSVTEDMTYGEVIETLGAPEDLLIPDGFAQYRVIDGDEERLLCLFYTDKDDTIGKDGRQLFDEAIPMNELYVDTENNTFECVVADIHDSGSVRVSCPQHPINCADFRYTNDPSLMNLHLGDRLLITYSGDVLEVYPCIIHVSGLEILTDNGDRVIEE